MGLFKKEPIDRWVDDMRLIAEADDVTFKSVEKAGRNMYAVVLGNEREGMVGRSDYGIVFMLTFGNLREMSESLNMHPASVYAALASQLMTTSVAVDENYDMYVSAIIPSEDYDSDAMEDMMYRWDFNVIDFDNACSAVLKAFGGDGQ